MKKTTHLPRKLLMSKVLYSSVLTIFIMTIVVLTVSSGYRKPEDDFLANLEAGDTIRIRLNNLENMILILEDSTAEKTLEFFNNGEFANVVKNKKTNKGVEYRYNSDGVLYKRWNIFWPENDGVYDYFNEYYMGDIDFPGIIKLGYVFEDEFLMLKSDTVMVLNYKNGKIVR